MLLLVGTATAGCNELVAFGLWLAKTEAIGCGFLCGFTFRCKAPDFLLDRRIISFGRGTLMR